MWLFTLIMVALFVGIPIGYICKTYIIEPGKSLREGLSDWYHESDDDF